MADPVSLPTNFLRLGKFPIDSTLVVSTYAELTAYATNNPTAYTGQIVSVTALNAAYIIRGDKSVLPLQTGALSGNWENTFNIVNTNSAEWESVYGIFNNLSANYQSVYSYVNLNSSKEQDQNETVAFVLNNSSTLIQVRTEVLSQSANNRSGYATWNSLSAGLVDVRTFNNNNSSTFIQVRTEVLDQSANNRNVYSIVNTNSADWNSVYSYVNLNSSKEQDQNETVAFVLSNSSTLLQVRTEVLSQSSNNRSVYSSWNSASGNILTNTFVTNNFIAKSSVDIQLSINSTNVVQNSAVATRIVAIENSLNVLAPAPTYNQPAATLTTFSPNIFEVGQTVNQSITVGYTPNDGGAATRFRIIKGTIASPITTRYDSTVGGGVTVNESVVLGTTTYTASVSHLSGAVKNNVLGLPDSRGIVTSGTKTLARTYDGYYREFFGSVTAVPVNLRTLTGTRLTNDSSIYSLYAYLNTNVIVIPTTRNLVSIIVQASNEDVTSNFTNNLTSINVNDAGGTARSYKRYSYQSALPFNSNLRITIS